MAGAARNRTRASAQHGRDAAVELAELEAVFSALAHPARRQILLGIRFRGAAMTAGDIVARFRCSWPTITRHLRVLEAAGLLRQEARGRHRHYHLDRDRLDLVARWLRWFDDPREPTDG